MTKVTSSSKVSSKNCEAANKFAANREARYARYKSNVTFGDGAKLPADDDMAIALNKLVEETVVEDKNYVLIADKAIEASTALETHMTALMTEKERDDYIFKLVDLAERAENKFGNERAGKVVNALIERINKIPAAVQFKLEEMVDIGSISGAISMLPTFMLTNERIESRINKAFNDAEEAVKTRVEKDEKERKEKAEAAVAEVKKAAVNAADKQAVDVNFVDKVKTLIQATTDLESPEAEAMLDVVGKLNFIRMKRLENVTLDTPAEEIVSILTSIGITKAWVKEFIQTLPVDAFASVFGKARSGYFTKEYLDVVNELLDAMSFEEIIDFCVEYYSEFGVAASKLSDFSEKEVKTVLEWTKVRSEPMFIATVKCLNLLFKAELVSGVINQARFNELSQVVTSVVAETNAEETVAVEPVVESEVTVQAEEIKSSPVVAGNSFNAVSEWMSTVIDGLAVSDKPEAEVYIDIFGELNLIKAASMTKHIDPETLTAKEITTALNGIGVNKAWLVKLIDQLIADRTVLSEFTSAFMDTEKFNDYLVSLKDALEVVGVEGIVEFSKDYAAKFGGSIENPAQMTADDLNARLFYISENKPELLNLCVVSIRSALDCLMMANTIKSDLAAAHLATLEIYDRAVANMSSEKKDEPVKVEKKEESVKAEKKEEPAKSEKPKTSTEQPHKQDALSRSKRVTDMKK